MTEYCTRVTGKAFAPHYSALPDSRRGPRRELDEVDMSERGMNRVQPVYDVLCGSPATMWVRAFDSIKAIYCCAGCLTAVVAKVSGMTPMGSRLPVTVGYIDLSCPETDKFGGHCVWVKGHVTNPHRFEGGDEDARHAEALERYHEERQARIDHETEDDEEDFATHMGHPGGHYG